jgi:hypothetical protein
VRGRSLIDAHGKPGPIRLRRGIRLVPVLRCDRFSCPPSPLAPLDLDLDLDPRSDWQLVAERRRDDAPRSRRPFARARITGPVTLVKSSRKGNASRSIEASCQRMPFRTRASAFRMPAARAGATSSARRREFFSGRLRGLDVRGRPFGSAGLRAPWPSVAHPPPARRRRSQSARRITDPVSGRRRERVARGSKAKELRSSASVSTGWRPAEAHGARRPR